MENKNISLSEREAITNALEASYLKNLHKLIRKIQVLCEKFEKRTFRQTMQARHPACFGLFLAEYILKLPILNIKTPIDVILLNARRLCEVLITIKYLNQKNNFEDFVLYCDRDRWEYLEGCVSREIADIALFPEQEGVPIYTQTIEREIKKLEMKYGKKPKGMPNYWEMAKCIDYEEEYKFFYKISSKYLHFSPMSFSGDIDFEPPEHKIMFLRRIERYLGKIKEELDLVYEKTKLKN